MAIKCEQFEANMAKCACTYEGCSRKGNCCACIHYHLSMDQLPACAFPPEAERTYDRSFGKFIEVHRE
jgi:hypothetical protein